MPAIKVKHGIVFNRILNLASGFHWTNGSNFYDYFPSVVEMDAVEPVALIGVYFHFTKIGQFFPFYCYGLIGNTNSVPRDRRNTATK